MDFVQLMSIVKPQLERNLLYLTKDMASSFQYTGFDREDASSIRLNFESSKSSMNFYIEYRTSDIEEADQKLRLNYRDLYSAFRDVKYDLLYHM